jgi:outer membrane protein OmpA-like peptidoglycan-associated protein
MQQSLFAQQNRYQWRAGIGVGNQFEDGKLTGKGDLQKDGLVSVDNDFLLYAASLEYLPSLAWGIKLQAISSPSFNELGRADLLFTYYTDNRDLFDRESFIAPYIGFGMGNNFVDEEMYFPLGLGIKFRLGDMVNLNLEYFTRTKIDQFNSEFSFNDDVIGFTQLSLNFNFGSRKDNFRGPVIYTSDSYNYVEDVLQPLSSDSLINPLELTYPTKPVQRQPEVNIAVIPLAKSAKSAKPEKQEADQSKKEKPYNITIINNNSFTVMQTPNGYQVISDSSASSVDSLKTKSYQKSDTILINPEEILLKQDSVFESEDSVLERADSMVSANDSITMVRNDSTLQNDIKQNLVDTSKVQNLEESSLLMGKSRKNEVDSVDGSQQNKSYIFTPSSQQKRDTTGADSLTNPLFGKKIQSDSSTSRKKANIADTTGMKPATSNIKKQTSKTTTDSTKLESDLQMKPMSKQSKQVEDSVKVKSQKAADEDSTKVQPTKQKNLLGGSSTPDLETTDNTEVKQENEQIEELKREIELLKTKQDAIEEKQGNTTETREVIIREKNNSGNNSRNDARINDLERQLAAERARTNQKLGVSAGISAQPIVSGNQTENDTIVMQQDSALAKEIAVMQKQIDLLTRALQKDSTAVQLETMDSTQNQMQIDVLNRKISEMERQLVQKKQLEDSLTAATNNYNEALKEVQGTNVFFNISESGLTQEAMNKLVKVLSFMNTHPSAIASLRGYTDPTGNAANNMALSKKRAQTVVDYLQRNGIGSARVYITYIGIDNSIDYNLRDYSFGRRVHISFQ